MSKQKKLFTSILACVLVVVLTVGGTLAYLTDSEWKTNTLTIGDVDIILEEPHWDDAQDGAALLAGDTYVKDPTVTQIIGSSYFRMVVTFMDMETGEQITDEDRLDLILQAIHYDSTYVSATSTPGTALVEGSSYTLADLEELPMVNPMFVEDTAKSVPGKYYFTYQSVLHEGSSVTLFTTVAVPVEWTQDQLKLMGDIKINVLAEAIQEKHFSTPMEAMAALDGEIEGNRLKENYGEVGRGVGEGKAVIPAKALYYSDFSTAMLDATNNTTENADLPNKVGAVACVVPDDASGATVYLMDDITLESGVEIANKAVTLNFNGFFITEAANARITSKAKCITLTNNGSNVSGGILKDHSGATSSTQMVYASKDMVILSGYYKSSGDSSKYAYGFVGGGTTVVESCTIDVSNVTHNATALQNQGTMTVNDATLFAHSDKRQVYGVVNFNSMTVNNATVHASNGLWYALGSAVFNKSQPGIYDADLLINDGSFYMSKTADPDTSSPAGTAIGNALGKITIMNCTAVGMNAGIYTGKNDGTGGVATDNVVYIYGGDFSSPNHGGAFFAGEQNYVFGGTFRNSNAYPDLAMGGFYVGSQYNEVFVYMNGATVQGGSYGGVCSSNYSFYDTTLYVSNTKFEGIDYDLRVDGVNGNGYQGHLYIGQNVIFNTVTGDGVIDTETYKDIAFDETYVEEIV